MFTAALIISLILGYSAVAPDRRTLSLTRGLRGAVRAVVGGGSSKPRPSFLRGAERRPRPAPSKPGKAGKTGKASAGKATGRKPFRGLVSMARTARSGWRQGVKEALALRESGGDLFSRLERGPIGRGARRVVQAGGRTWGSARGWWNDRHTPAEPEASEHRATATARARRTAGGGDDRDTGVVFLSDYRVWPGDSGGASGRTYGGPDCACSVCAAGRPDLCGWQDAPELHVIDDQPGPGPDQDNVIELGPDDWSEAKDSPCRGCGRLTANLGPDGPICFGCVDPNLWGGASDRLRRDLGAIGLPGHDAWLGLFDDMTDNTTTRITNERKGKTMQTTDLENLDAVRAEAAAAREAATAMAEQLTDMQTWASSLADRWSGTNWSTTGLNSAIANVADSVPQIDPEALLAALDGIDAAANEAATVAEVADQVGAEGELSNFRAG